MPRQTQAKGDNDKARKGGLDSRLHRAFWDWMEHKEREVIRDSDGNIEITPKLAEAYKEFVSILGERNYITPELKANPKAKSLTQDLPIVSDELKAIFHEVRRRIGMD